MKKVILRKLNISIQYSDKDFENAAETYIETRGGELGLYIITYLEEDDVYILVPKSRYKEIKENDNNVGKN